MIPPFNELGYLPEGIFPATLSEIDARFGCGSEIRRVQMESLRWMVELAVRASVQRIILNGSFVADIMEPNDVDCALALKPGGSKDLRAEADFRKGLPFIDISFADPCYVDCSSNSLFAFDRRQVGKGMVEIIL